MKQKQSGFTLIEILVVIAIVAVLIAVLFPVFASVRAKGRQTVCVSNLHQLSLGVLQYAQDFDDHYPYGGDPGDLNTNGWEYSANGKYWPAIQQMQTAHQTLPNVMSGYIKDRGLWHCPADNGFAMAGQRETIPLDASPSAFEAFGMSYAYTTELALEGQTITSVRAWSRKPPYSEHSQADVPLFYDLVGHWHGSWDQGRYNFVMLDGHAVNVSRARSDELHYILFTITAPLNP